MVKKVMVNKTRNRMLLVILILLIWEIIAQLGIYNEALLPSIFKISNVFIAEMLNGNLLFAILYSFKSILIGLVISLMISTILIIISKLNHTFDDLLDFTISVAHPIPGIALLPLIILWIGIGTKATIFVIVHSMIWPLLINIKTEIAKIESKYKKISKVFNFSLLKTIGTLYIMGSVPAVVSGCKIAWSRGWRAFISVEMVFGIVGGNSGLGWYIFEQRVYMNSPGLYSGILAIIVCGIVVENLVFKPLENSLENRWSY